MLRQRGTLFSLMLVAALVVAGLTVLRKLSRDTPSPTIPDEYRPTVVAAAATCPRLTVPLMAAQLDAESGWRADADSGRAQGIAQFTPTTWRQWGRDEDGDGTADVWNPKDAIPAQARYMCHLYTVVADLPGDPTELALAAYNAGPNAVRRARGVPRYDETAEYVDRILNTLLPRYRKTEGDASPSADTTSDRGTSAPQSGG